MQLPFLTFNLGYTTKCFQFTCFHFKQHFLGMRVSHKSNYTCTKFLLKDEMLTKKSGTSQLTDQQCFCASSFVHRTQGRLCVKQMLALCLLWENLAVWLHHAQTAGSALGSSFVWETILVCHQTPGTSQMACGALLVPMISCLINHVQCEHCTCLGIGNTARNLGERRSHWELYPVSWNNFKLRSCNKFLAPTKRINNFQTYSEH